MKRLWICTGILGVILSLSLFTSFRLDKTTHALTDTLEKAQQSAESGDWVTARELTQQARTQWDGATNYLYIILRHSDTDEVQGGFESVAELLEWEEEAEYTSENAQLIEDILLLSEMESFNLKNLL